MSKIPLTVVDNFFEDPDKIREYALSLEYAKGKGNWPGERTNFLEKIDMPMAKKIAEQIISLFVDLRVHEIGWDIESQFQLISSDYEFGLIHNDLSVEKWDIAGVVYLNPDAPLDAGTSIHRINPNIDVSTLDFNLDELYDLKHKFYLGENDGTRYKELRNIYNNTFEKTVGVSNVYNRLVAYSTNEFHQADKYFGNTKDDSRLTFVFFAKFEHPDWVKFPLDRVVDIVEGNNNE
jgi:Family of unknown function (DUF6445)